MQGITNFLGLQRQGCCPAYSAGLPDTQTAAQFLPPLASPGPGNTLPAQETATPAPGCSSADITGTTLCPQPSGYLCACVAAGGETWVPRAEVRTRCAKLAEFLQFPGVWEEGEKICRVRAGVDASLGAGMVQDGKRAPEGSRLYYGMHDSISDMCQFTMPDGPKPCNVEWGSLDDGFDLLCEQLA